jgi:TolA-binding protein
MMVDAATAPFVQQNVAFGAGFGQAAGVAAAPGAGLSAQQLQAQLDLYRAAAQDAAARDEAAARAAADAERSLRSRMQELQEQERRLNQKIEQLQKCLEQLNSMSDRLLPADPSQAPSRALAGHRGAGVDRGERSAGDPDAYRVRPAGHNVPLRLPTSVSRGANPMPHRLEVDAAAIQRQASGM